MSFGLAVRARTTTDTARGHARYLQGRPIHEPVLQDLRTNADRALAIYDGIASNFRFSKNEHYYLLGGIDLTVRLPHKPMRWEGQVYLSIFTDSVKATN